MRGRGGMPVRLAGTAGEGSDIITHPRRSFGRRSPRILGDRPWHFLRTTGNAVSQMESLGADAGDGELKPPLEIEATRRNLSSKSET